MDKVGTYTIKPFSKYRKNIVIVTHEGWRKRSHHSVLEIDVTDSKKHIKKYFEKTGVKISFTGWIIKCIAQTMVEYKQFNALRHGNNKIIEFDDVDIAIPIEKHFKNEIRPVGHVIRKANEKSVLDITEEIRKLQKQKIDENSQVIGQELDFVERLAINAPSFLKKIVLFFGRKRAVFRKKHLGTVGVTAIGMKGKFPGWVVPLGGVTSSLFVVGGITKKPGVVNDEIKIRQYLHLTLTADHDLIDGGPLVRFIEKLVERLESSYELKELV